MKPCRSRTERSARLKTPTPRRRCSAAYYQSSARSQLPPKEASMQQTTVSEGQLVEQYQNARHLILRQDRDQAGSIHEHGPARATVTTLGPPTWRYGSE